MCRGSRTAGQPRDEGGPQVVQSEGLKVVRGREDPVGGVVRVQGVAVENVEG